MEHVHWTARPSLDEPVLVAAFEGWNDAGDAATGAVRWFRDQWTANAFAEIDPEEFYDFTSTRPHVRLTPSREREVVWPENQFCSARTSAGRDIVLLIGSEPQLRWRTFCAQVISVANALDVRMLITLGALLAEVAHTRPVSVIGNAYDPEVVERLDLTQSGYEGPTGIVGVLHDACRLARIPSASLWAAVPTYVPGAPSPKATLALVERAGQLLELDVHATDLEIATASYERQINELVSADDETAEYVARLEERYDRGDDDEDDDDGETEVADPATATSLIEEVERFLREQ
jgi:proteasome assembly chaperone (PAC2) family protein